MHWLGNEWSQIVVTKWTIVNIISEESTDCSDLNSYQNNFHIGSFESDPNS